MIPAVPAAPTHALPVGAALPLPGDLTSSSFHAGPTLTSSTRMTINSQIGFREAPGFTSDVQMTHTRSPDGQEMSILFDNLVLRAGACDPAPVSPARFSLLLGLEGGAAMLRVRLQLRGALHLSGGFRAAACLFAGGGVLSSRRPYRRRG